MQCHALRGAGCGTDFQSLRHSSINLNTRQNFTYKCEKRHFMLKQLGRVFLLKKIYAALNDQSSG